MRDFLATLGAGLRLAFLLSPSPRLRFRPHAHFWPLLLIGGVLGVWNSVLVSPPPLQFNAEGVYALALDGLIAIAMGILAARVLGQAVLGWAASVMLLAGATWVYAGTLALLQAMLSLEWATPTRMQNLIHAQMGWYLLMILRWLHWQFPQAPVWRHSALSLLIAALMLAPSQFLQQPGFLSTDWEAYNAAMVPPSRPLKGSAEQVMEAQPARVESALASVPAGVPGRVEAYLLAFGADADEEVFRNEVEYATRLFAARFDVGERHLRLLNHPDTTDTLPLATRSNLRRALRGLGQRMNPDEDLLVLFMTTHGSEDHELYVNLEPLPLDQIGPADIREALDEAGITWRVLIVSACYSGGFVTELSSPTSLVLTAARPDRSSFGCGVDSDITYFGEALLVHALNRTTSFAKAYAMAKARVAEREAETEYLPSEPQMAMGALMAPKLAAWESSLRGGPAIPFTPAATAPAPSPERHAATRE